MISKYPPKVAAPLIISFPRAINIPPNPLDIKYHILVYNILIFMINSKITRNSSNSSWVFENDKESIFSRSTEAFKNKKNDCLNS